MNIDKGRFRRPFYFGLSARAYLARFSLTKNFRNIGIRKFLEILFMSKRKDKNGYIRVRVGKHPRARGGEVFEHILLMEAYLGRSLPKGSEVHHRNRKRDDNSIDNLLLMRTKDDHRSLHRAIDADDKRLVQAHEAFSKAFMAKLKAGYSEEECFAATVDVKLRVLVKDVPSMENISVLREQLFVELKSERKRLAQNAEVPAYIIFHDKTLKEISVSMPDTHAKLLQVKGIGPHKVKAYGDQILSVVKLFMSRKGFHANQLQVQKKKTA